MIDIQEAVYELEIRGIEGFSTTSEIRRALRMVLNPQSDPEGSIVEAEVQRCNPDREYAVCGDLLEVINREFKDGAGDEHSRRRTRSRLMLLGMRVSRGAKLMLMIWQLL